MRYSSLLPLGAYILRTFRENIHPGAMSLSVETTHHESNKRERPESEGADAAEDGAIKRQHLETSANSDDVSEDRWKLRKSLLLVSYSGKGYLGMQRNPGCRTIEEELLSALYKAKAIPEHGYKEQQSIWFQRAARTDKGVSAARQCVSLKMVQDSGILEAINSHLPDQIRVFAVKRVTKRFDAKLQCSARTYLYLAPTYAFCPVDTVVTEDYRITDDVLKNVNRLFGKYKGTHNYHNFTSRRKPSDPSNHRYIISMECSPAFIQDGLEFTAIKVKGQSFMLHQIRKMVGLVVAVARGQADESVMDRAWGQERLDLPVAPSLGLVLEEVHYDRYNKKFGSGGSNTHDNIDWSGVEQLVQDFKEKYIYTEILQTERQERSMLSWLATLPLHSFDVREDGARNGSALFEAKRLAEREAAESAPSTPSASQCQGPQGETAQSPAGGASVQEAQVPAAPTDGSGVPADSTAVPPGLGDGERCDVTGQSAVTADVDTNS